MTTIPETPTPLVLPSDEWPAPPFRLGGRVLSADGARWVVGDAFAHRAVRCTDDRALPRALRAGDLIEAFIERIDANGEALAREIVVVGSDRRGGPGEALRLSTRGRGGLIRERARLLGEVRGFFEARGFTEVETPTLVPCPGLDFHLDAFAAGEQRGPDGYPDASSRYLITSPEYQMKRLLAAGVFRSFQISRCFRRGEVGARHNPEFTMLEWYRGFAAVESVIDDTESLVIALAKAARGEASVVTPAGRTIELHPPFERLPILTAFARHAQVSESTALGWALSGDEADETRFFETLAFEVEPALAEGPPVFVCDYPAPQASLARKKPDAPHLAERFELFVGGIELCNGFGELVDGDEQRARFAADRRLRAEKGKPVYPIDEGFLGALAEGLPPSAGNALGLDRLIALCLGAKEIGDVMTFPEGWL